MAWENRGSLTPYYYRKVRGGDGRVRSTYVGKGPLAECIAELDGAVRAARRYHVESVRQAEAVLDGAGEATEALTSAVRVRLGIHLAGLGLRYHRGDWRKPRASGATGSEPVQPTIPGPRVAGDRVPQLLAPVPSTLQIRGVMAEARDGLQSELSPPTVLPWGDSGFMVQSLRSDAWGLRVMAERAVMRGDGHKGNRTFRAFAAAARSVVESWGDVAVEPADPDDESPLERRRRAGRVALGRTSAARPHTGSAAETALAVAAVLDEVGQEGRFAVTVALRRVRGEMGWASASPLGRAVIDQYALAQAHADLGAAFDSGSAGQRARQGRLQMSQEPTEGDALIDALVGALGPSGAAWAARARRDTYDSTPSPIVAWERRARRTKRRLADAARLVRHARKTGLILDGPDGAGPARPSEWVPDDPVVALARAAPLDPLVGEAAEFAAGFRASIDARRAAWPPPDMMKWNELDDPAGLWSIFDFVPSEVDPEGRPHDGSVWAVRLHPPDHPNASLAYLAEWAPEYAEPS